MPAPWIENHHIQQCRPATLRDTTTSACWAVYVDCVYRFFGDNVRLVLSHENKVSREKSHHAFIFEFSL